MAAPTGITAAQVDADSVVDVTVMELIKDWIDYLYGEVGGGGNFVLNGSFEIDADADGTPDQWDVTAYAGGTIGLETTSPIEGASTLKMTHPGGAGNGGGYADSGFIECNWAAPFVLGMIHKASAAGMKNMVTIRFFDKDQVDLSLDDTIYESIVNPVASKNILMAVSPPATARYLKIRLIGGYTDTDVAGDAYFDRITVTPLLIKKGHSVISFGTIAEQSTASGTYVDVGSCTVSLPLRELPARLTFTAEMKVNVGTGYMRFRIGSEYSNEVSTTDLAYATKAMTMTIADTGQGDITLYMQLYNSGGTTYGQVPTPAGVVTLDMDEIFA